MLPDPIPPAYGRRVISWLGDFVRFWWALPYWNLRKTLFRLRGRDPVDCPCQHPSDSGLAYQTRCEAAATWNRAARVRCVCPLLVGTPEGLRCSIAAANVRPFWGRACAFAAGAFVALYLGGVLLAFLGLKGIGEGHRAFVRVSGNQPWTRLGSEPLVHEITANLGRLGL